MSSPSSIGVNDDLASSEAGVSVGSPNDESPRGVQVEDGLIVKVLCRDDGLDDVLEEVGADLVVGHVGIVLGGDEDGVDSLGEEGSRVGGVALVLDGDLGLSVGPEPRADSVLPNLGELVANLGGEDVGEGHQLGGLVSGIAKHMSLVSSSELLERLGVHAVDALSDVGRLLLNVDEDLALGSVKADVVRDETDLCAGLADNGLVVNLCLGGDLTEDHDHVGLCASLAGDLMRNLIDVSCFACTDRRRERLID